MSGASTKPADRVAPPELPAERPLDEQRGDTFASLVALMQRLLGPGGCPWDREQDMRSLRRYVLEEACEVIDAIDQGDLDQVRDELGDLALQIAFLAELARKAGAFGPDDVMRGIVEKLIRRHPHVFGDIEVSGSDEVTKNWEAIKEVERGPRGLLDGIPRALPALYGAERVSRKVSQVGFDWPDVRGSRAKVDEELAELDRAMVEGDEDAVEAELGDVLFALVNLARHRGVDAEHALRRTTDKFRQRFAHVEQRVRAEHGDWPRGEDGKPTTGLRLEELDAYWEEAKA